MNRALETQVDAERPEATTTPEQPTLDSSTPERPPGHQATVSDCVVGYTSLEDMLCALLERIHDSLDFDTAAVLLLDEDRGVLLARAARGLEEEVRQGVQVPLARGFAGRVAAEGRPIVIEDLDHAEVVNPILRQKGIRSMLGVPVHVEGRVIGVMHIGTLAQRFFDEDDVALLQLAADRAALAIDNARLSEQRAVTAIMQRTLLPDALPQIPGVQLSAKYLPAGSGVKIGGDWYDVFQLASGRVVFVIGDVVGRGVLAASVMAEIRIALRAYLMQEQDLPRVVALLNELLVTMGRNRSATLSIVQFDPDAQEIEVLTAGHLPPLLVDRAGRAVLLEQPHGLPVGVGACQHYSARRYPFPTGTRLLLYTDGLIERRGESIDAGFGRLKRAAGEAAQRTDASFADRVYRVLLDETPLEDDMALLAIETQPLEDALDLTLHARPDVLAGLRGTLGRWLAAAGADEGELFDITLSTSEAAANAVEHAYGAREATFTVRCEHDGEVVRVIVADHGRWRALRPHGGGRGVEIMRSLMDSVAVDSNDDGTVVTMARKLSAGA
ncbi:MAG TPA: SpoIIE family protein phosphatase [Solirubrobacteraceae bacterium]|jgi:serine phosphatase RsbU (regulator of sigma subunit)/anti-sigma regulatory factor (Ser/Thr protein kinase)|nr:SpoIIE family protein phosphatase [Solirubrobacteraceae bacterium]